MSDREEVWQVAGRRRHRRPGGSESDKQQHQSELRRTNHNRHGSNRNNSSSSDVHGRNKSKGKASHGGYSYKTIGTRQPPLGQGTDGSREDVTWRELAKLDKLKVLLRGTALWERLVEGLGSTLAQLGLAASNGNEETAAEASPADAVSTGSLADGSGNTHSGEVDSPAAARPDALRELVCYGIGNFTESDSSRYQLALALCLHDLLSAASSCASDVAAGGAPSAAASHAAGSGSGSVSPGPALLAFDPVMGETETAILEALGCGLLQNEEGKRSCCRRGETAGGGGGDGGVLERDAVGEMFTTPTLFFMPHCPQRLYSNVLWANWSSRGLGSIVILGNKLSSYGDRLLDARARSDPTNALLRVGPLFQDVDLLPYPASDRARWRRDVGTLPGLERAFNDLALSFSGPEARGSAGGVKALGDRPLEFVEAEDGELVTGRAAPPRDVN